jgi:hypothetical protein
MIINHEKHRYNPLKKVFQVQNILIQSLHWVNFFFIEDI